MRRLEEIGYKTEISEKLLEFLSQVGFDPVYGARPLKRAIQNQVENPLAQLILSGKVLPGKALMLDLDGDHLQVRQ